VRDQPKLQFFNEINHLQHRLRVVSFYGHDPPRRIVPQIRPKNEPGLLASAEFFFRVRRL
jgi:hypothetical protein